MKVIRVSKPFSNLLEAYPPRMNGKYCIRRDDGNKCILLLFEATGIETGKEQNEVFPLTWDIKKAAREVRKWMNVYSAYDDWYVSKHHTGIKNVVMRLNKSRSASA